jgi:hypothetical protein
VRRRRKSRKDDGENTGNGSSWLHLGGLDGVTERKIKDLLRESLRDAGLHEKTCSRCGSWIMTRDPEAKMCPLCQSAN